MGNEFKVGEAADLLGVSDDTLRRWAEAGRVSIVRGPNGRQVVPGVELAALAQSLATGHERTGGATVSARNQLRGLVTKVTRDTVMAQVEMQAGPFRLVSLMSREAADELGLEPGCLAVASVKATNVVVEVPPT
ncbi:molybdopterin-binding protein [Jannaschia sp. R86511]|uniref:TOBE domain-containing protein n=1 Tax=Jannaschia sp. R86511 TaxID=3093853 RepID=UPI0036D25005